MPTYEYKCDFCGNTFEVYSTRMDGGRPKELCPYCKETGYKILSYVMHKNKKKGKP